MRSAVLCTDWNQEATHGWIREEKRKRSFRGRGRKGGGGEKEREGERDWPLRGSHVIGILH